MKEIKDIDLIIRSKMTDVEEEVPARLWSSISASLDQEKQKTAPVVFWRRTAYALAAAAAIAAVIILNPWATKHSDTQEVLAYTEQTEVYEETTAPELTEIIAETVEQKTVVKAVKEKVIAEPTAETTEVKEEATGEKDGQQGQEYTRRPGNRSRYVHDNTPWVDPFAELETATKVRKKPSIYLSGNMNSNGSPKSGNNQVFSGLPGEGTLVKTIEQTSKESNYTIPFTVGLGVRIPINEKISIGTGVNYTLLARSFTGVYSESRNGSVVYTVNRKIKNELHYVGIPINVYYNLFNSQFVDVYSFGGLGVEKGLANVFRLQDNLGQIRVSEKVKGIQLSVSAGLGMRFRLQDQLDLYVDPGIAYYFNCKQPTSIRTQQPLMMTFSVGLKYNI